jgi:hypothetical protein
MTFLCLGVWIVCACAGGCGGHGGIVRAIVPSKDGRAVMYHGENVGEGTWVADGSGATRVGDDGAAFLSPDGRYVFLVTSDVNSPRWPGKRLLLYDVAERLPRDGGPVSQSLYNPRSLPVEAGWEPALMGVYLDAGPAVVMGVQMVKFNESPRLVSAMQYIRWTPGAEHALLAGPRGVAFLSKPVNTDANDSWVVVRRPGDGEPYRTVWVHPDGNVIELLRSTQSAGSTAFMIGMFPMFFWSESYYRMGSWLDERNLADPQATQDEERRIQRLVELRKAGHSGSDHRAP